VRDDWPREGILRVEIMRPGAAVLGNGPQNLPGTLEVSTMSPASTPASAPFQPETKQIHEEALDEFRSIMRLLSGDE
jgi:hypothetical protein